MLFIGIIGIIIYFVEIAWTWHSLGDIEKGKRIAIIIIGIMIMALISLIIFNISKSGINYENDNIEKDVRNVLVILFTGLNGIIFMPQYAKIFGKISVDEISKNSASTRFLIWTIIFIICIIIECRYMKNIQLGILDLYLHPKQ